MREHRIEGVGDVDAEAGRLSRMALRKRNQRALNALTIGSVSGLIEGIGWTLYVQHGVLDPAIGAVALIILGALIYISFSYLLRMEDA